MANESKFNEIVRSVVGPDQKIYRAVYPQAKDRDQIMDLVTELGLSLEDVNHAMLVAKKKIYEHALTQTVDSRIDAAVTKLMEVGWSKEEAIQAANLKRGTMASGLPKGLTASLNADGTPKISKRGLKTDEPTAEVTPASDAPEVASLDAPEVA